MAPYLLLLTGLCVIVDFSASEIFSGTRHDLVEANAFVAIHIRSPKIRENIERVQQEMLWRNRSLDSTMVSLDKLHITLMVLRLDNEGEEEKAIKNLCNATDFISPSMKEPLKVTVKGIGTFSNQVVYAKIEEAETLADIAETLRTQFKNGGLPTTDPKKFTAHLTIAKTHKGSVKSIPSSSYSGLHGAYFGTDLVDELELLSMSKPSDKHGYYYIFGTCRLLSK